MWITGDYLETGSDYILQDIVFKNCSASKGAAFFLQLRKRRGKNKVLIQNVTVLFVISYEGGAIYAEKVGLYLRDW